METPASVTTWIGRLEQGEPLAAQHLWERYFARLVELAHGQLRGMSRRVADEEDIALSAFHGFCQAVAQQRLPQLNNRDDLWRTLVLITAGKAVDERRRQQSRKRGGRPGEAANGPCDFVALENVIGTEPDPAFAALVADEFRTLLARLPDDRLRAIALLKLEGYSNEEIASRLDCGLRTVTRRLLVIRRTWQAAG